MTHLSVPNLIGFFGDFITLWAYVALQLNKMKHNQLSYILLNLFGSLCILFSLYFSPNLPSTIIEISWTLISLYGVYKAIEEKQKCNS